MSFKVLGFQTNSFLLRQCASLFTLPFSNSTFTSDMNASSESSLACGPARGSLFDAPE